ncbi:hypothetical protein Leryth_007182 [Lithospermum erythrorhizon]|nr:hypothetical protein Leryth_007182 [Lithospermum erythrorhizon]
MALAPGFLTDWPWKSLGRFKYLVLAPFAFQSLYSFAAKENSEMDVVNLLIIPLLLSRILHNQIWITISRHLTTKGKNRIVDKTIEFDQVDRESNWDDQILLQGFLFYIFNLTITKASYLPFWRFDGLIITMLLHTGPVEYLYYWLHRALHHHFLYSRYHSHHHSSIVTEPITSVIHPFAEHIAYFVLFAIPMLTTVFTGTASMASLFGYVTYIDFMNNMGHCNFELIPKELFAFLPPLKYLMYTPSFHSLHHTQFRTNYSLFMPFYDYVYGTMDEYSDALHESALKRKEESPDVVHLTHLTTPESIYHLRLGFASFASRPQESKWFMFFIWPITCWSMIMNSMFSRTFISERNVVGTLKLQSWIIPRYMMQYHIKWRKEAISDLIEEAILEADKLGVKVLTLGFLNQDKELNNHGNLYVKRHPELQVKVVDGSGLAAAVVINSIPKGTSEVFLHGKPSKMATALGSALSQRGIRLASSYGGSYENFHKMSRNSLEAESIKQKVWLVGEGLSDEEQQKASKGTIFIPYSQFPPKRLRNDCFYCYTPALMAPKSIQNIDSCENWLPRRAMSAWRIAGIVHALEGWKAHECGDAILNIDEVWKASLHHGFSPMKFPSK